LGVIYRIDTFWQPAVLHTGRSANGRKKREVPMARLRTLLVVGALAAVAVVSTAVPALTISW